MSTITLMPRRSVSRAGITLIEILVSTFIMTIMAGALYSVFSHMTYTRSIANARGTAKQEVEIALRQIERDIAGTRAGTFQDSTAGKLAMTITQKSAVTTGVAGFDILDVEYSWGTSGVLKRKVGTLERVLMQNLKTFQVSRESGSGTIHLKLVACVKPEGFPNAPQEHSQDVLATIREEAAGAGSDTRWVRPKDLSANQF